MEIVRGLHNLKPAHRGCVLSIGNFDGVHLGHQKLIERLNELADQAQVPATVLVFEPMPAEFFQGRSVVRRLQRFREKADALEKLGVDRLICLRFCEQIRSLSAAQFIENVLVAKLGIRHIIIGADFCFGADRKGNSAELDRRGTELGFETETSPLVVQQGEKVGSTAIREALAAGNMQQAANYLGRQYSLSGRVTAGRQVARQLGFPTMNIPLRRTTALRYGVYTVRAKSAGKIFNAVANVGIRPTFGDSEALVEVHSLSDDAYSYGDRVEVEFLSFLRPEVKFNSADELSSQIAIDKRDALQFFADEITQSSVSAF